MHFTKKKDKHILYKLYESASRFSRGAVLNMLKQSGINILRGKKDTTTFSRQACFVNRFTLQGFNERIFPVASEIIASVTSTL